MKIVSTAPSMSSCCTAESDSLMRCESSRMTVSLTSLGSVRSSSPMTSRTDCATSTVLEPEILSTSIDTAGVPSSSEALRFSAVPSTTVATSPSLTATCPRGPWRTETAMSANAAGSTTRPVTRTSCSVAPRCTRPAGTSWFSRWSAAITCGGLTP